MKEKVVAVLAQIRPALQSDGGDVELVDVNEGIVRLTKAQRCLCWLPDGNYDLTARD